jgi:hypothetical protein
MTFCARRERRFNPGTRANDVPANGSNNDRSAQLYRKANSELAETGSGTSEMVRAIAQNWRSSSARLLFDSAADTERRWTVLQGECVRQEPIAREWLLRKNRSGFVCA